MSNTARKSVQMTVYLEPDVADALLVYWKRTNKGKSTIINDAVRAILMPPVDSDVTVELRKSIDRLTHQFQKHDKQNHNELDLIKEMLAVFVRTYLNHTPEVPREHRAAAGASGRQRFERYLALLIDSLRPGRSILESAPIVSPKLKKPSVTKTQEPRKELSNASC